MADYLRACSLLYSGHPQGNLSQIGVKMSDVGVIDANFAKLAAKGISIMISSGDSGSGYAGAGGACEAPGSSGVGIEGTLSHSIPVEGGYEACCEQAQQYASKGWTFSKKAPVAEAAASTPVVNSLPPFARRARPLRRVVV